MSSSSIDDVQTTTSPQEPSSTLAWDTIYRGFLLLVGTGSLLSGTVAVAVALGDFHPWFDLVVHTSWHVLWGTLLLCGLIAIGWFFSSARWRSRWKDRAVLVLVPSIFFLSVCRPWEALPFLSNDRTDDGLRIYTWNLWQGNQDLDAFQGAIESIDPDIIVLIELAPWHEPMLVELAKKYPTHEWHLFGAAGMAVFSRIEGTTMETRILPREPVPVFDISVPETEHSKPLRIFASHTMSPSLQPEATWIRNEQLAALGDWVQETGERGIVLGDLNITPWSGAFRRLLRNADLIDTRIYRGYFGSWPTILHSWGVPIDHVLVTKDIDVRYRGVDDYSKGSDHRSTLTIVR